MPQPATTGHRTGGVVSRPGPAPQPRLPWEPFAEWVTERHTPITGDAHNRSVVAVVANRFGINVQTAHRWQQAGSVPAWNIDVLLHEHSIHPSEIWGDDWWALLDAKEQQATA